MIGPTRESKARRSAGIFELVRLLCEGREALRPALLELLPTNPGELTEYLLGLAVRHAGTPESQAACRCHLRRRNWSNWLPVAGLEYRAILGDDPRFDLGIRAALTLSGWAANHRRRIERAGRSRQVRAAATDLMRDLDAVASEASTLLGRVETLRREIKPPLHAVQAQALLRAQDALGTLRGVRALDIGCGSGALVDALRTRGAVVVGMDLIAPAGTSGFNIIRADFSDGLPPSRYDLVAATGVFEAGSCKAQEPQGRSLSGERLLAKLKVVTAPGGVVVLENFGLPLPFSLGLARTAGFELVPQAIPSVNLALGGRGCTLRLVS